MSRRILTNLLLLITFLIPSITEGTVCAGIPTVEQEYESSSLIFIGRASQVSPVTGATQIIVKKVFKGKPEHEVEILGGKGEGLSFEPGERYLIYASEAKEKGPIRVSICSRSNNLKIASSDLKKLEELNKAQTHRTVARR
jgi:hypothetical protein